jgi:uncharacterized protein DUF5752
MAAAAKEPFRFVTASSMVRILPERARTLDQLMRYIESVSDGSIFHHTFQSLETHHYVAYSNDFAQWALAACNETELAERLASVDLREFVSLEDLRKVLLAILKSGQTERPVAFDRPAYEPFYFCEAEEVVIPVEFQAQTLEELATGIQRMSLQTLHYHFVNSRLRLRLRTNDFSRWIEESLDFPALAERLNHIDIYTNSLERVRREILRMMMPWINR